VKSANPTTAIVERDLDARVALFRTHRVYEQTVTVAVAVAAGAGEAPGGQMRIIPRRRRGTCSAVGVSEVLGKKGKMDSSSSSRESDSDRVDREMKKSRAEKTVRFTFGEGTQISSAP
jgi:hypothetical protein